MFDIVLALAVICVDYAAPCSSNEVKSEADEVDITEDTRDRHELMQLVQKVAIVKTKKIERDPMDYLPNSYGDDVPDVEIHPEN